MNHKDQVVLDLVELDWLIQRKRLTLVLINFYGKENTALLFLKKLLFLVYLNRGIPSRIVALRKLTHTLEQNVPFCMCVVRESIPKCWKPKVNQNLGLVTSDFSATCCLFLLVGCYWSIKQLLLPIFSDSCKFQEQSSFSRETHRQALVMPRTIWVLEYIKEFDW